jgi:hypothetical protein
LAPIKAVGAINNPLAPIVWWLLRISVIVASDYGIVAKDFGDRGQT